MSNAFAPVSNAHSAQPQPWHQPRPQCHVPILHPSIVEPLAQWVTHGKEVPLVQPSPIQKMQVPFLDRPRPISLPIRFILCVATRHRSV